MTPQMMISVLALAAIYVLFLAKAWNDDVESIRRMQQHDVECPVCRAVETVDYRNPAHVHDLMRTAITHECRYGVHSDSRVKKLLANTRDQMVRGAIIGLALGSATTTVEGAIIFSLAGGIVTGIGDLLAWNMKLYPHSG